MRKQRFKAYVVFRGRIPGIYESWSEVREQTDHFASCRFRGCETYDDALAQWDVFEETGKIPAAEKKSAPASTRDPITLKARHLVATHSLPDGSGSHTSTCTATTCKYPLCQCQ